MSAVAVRCPTTECEAEIEIKVLYLSSRYDWRRGWKPARVIAIAPNSCPQAHTLDEGTRKQLENAAIAERECLSCFEPITEAEQSFEVKYGRVHERCRNEYNAMTMDEECGPDPRPEPHVAEWPADAYKPWIR